MNRKSQHGFAHILAVFLVVIVLGAIGDTGYYVYHKNHEQKKDTANSSQKSDNKTTAKITNYDECTKATDSKIQETYPQVCVAKTGQTFAQPNAQKYLEIKELGIKVPLDNTLVGAYYVINKDHPSTAYLSVHSLDKYSGCRAENEGVAAVSSFTEGESDPVNGSLQDTFSEAPKIGGKYYYITGNQYDCTGGKATELYSSVRAAFSKEYPNIQGL